MHPPHYSESEAHRVGVPRCRSSTVEAATSTASEHDAEHAGRSQSVRWLGDDRRAGRECLEAARVWKSSAVRRSDGAPFTVGRPRRRPPARRFRASLTVWRDGAASARALAQGVQIAPTSSHRRAGTMVRRITMNSPEKSNSLIILAPERFDQYARRPRPRGSVISPAARPFVSAATTWPVQRRPRVADL